MLILKHKNRKFWTVLTVLYMFLLLGSSFQAGTNAGGHLSTIKQLAYNLTHIPAYSLLALLLFYSSGSRFPIRVFVAAFVYGAFNEYVQSFIPGRTASVMDMFLNAIGAGLTLLFLRKQGTINQKPSTIN